MCNFNSLDSNRKVVETFAMAFMCVVSDELAGQRAFGLDDGSRHAPLKIVGPLPATIAGFRRDCTEDELLQRVMAVAPAFALGENGATTTSAR